MKWLLTIGVLAVLTLSGCCQSGGLFNRQPAYGSYYQPANYYAAPATTYAADPCACQ
ncbi:MAG TPA: hypothetical protein VFI31_30285 [Pirellulales bacterium]|nr:hypothetical protein [Pirellulales bacterium]